MRTLFFTLLLSCFSLLQASTPPATVPYVDLVRYAGVWYEIAKYPQWFEKGMTHVTAEYTPYQHYVRVINRGLKEGKKKRAKGKAFVVKNSGNAKLRVQFFWPFRGDYWIIDLAEDYSWAVVSNKNRSTLWILSRTSKMPDRILFTILRKLRKDGFDLTKLTMTDQSPMASTAQ